ncbi:sensor histidine kinase [Zhouia sp. PK063]|uniref:sensor histidine kinase n=1 Tax=Zhouia sp. PK063 TaxID=3373602 RepID=UPI0037A07544
MSSLTIHKKQWHYVVIHITAWLLLFAIMNVQIYAELRMIPKEILIKFLINILLFYFNYSFLVPKLLLKNNKLGWYLLCCLGIVIIYIAFDSYFIGPPRRHEWLKNMPTPPDFPRHAGEMMHNDWFNTRRFFMPFVVISIHFIVGTAIKIYDDWTDNRKIKDQIENERVNSELQFLKAQLNPHFLFNSLNSIYSLSVKKSNDTADAILTLSELMRYMLYEANQNLVPLQKELEYIQHYIKLQHLRLSNSEAVSLNIYGNSRHKKIQPLLFISFIENAFKYGTDFKGNTIVKIAITINDDHIHFYCSNIIGSYKKNLINSGVGLKNVQNRLQLLYPNAHELNITNNGKTFTVSLTLNTIHDEMYNN